MTTVTTLVLNIAQDGLFPCHMRPAIRHYSCQLRGLSCTELQICTKSYENAADRAPYAAAVRTRYGNSGVGLRSGRPDTYLLLVVWRAHTCNSWMPSSSR